MSSTLMLRTTDEFKSTSVILNTSVTDKASLSSHLPLQTTHILHRLEIEQDLPCIVDVTFDLMLLSLWPPIWPFLLVMLCQLQLSCVSASLSCVAWRSRLMTKSSSWPRGLLSPLPARASGRRPGSSRGMMCRISKWNKFKMWVKATKLCKAKPHPVFWLCRMWAGSTLECTCALIDTLEKLKRFLCLSQVRSDLLFTQSSVIAYRRCLTFVSSTGNMTVSPSQNSETK